MPPAFIVIDFESYYDTTYSLKRLTPVEYILDPRFECIGASITEGNDGVPFWLDADQLPAYLESKRELPIPFISHNALFDMCLLAWRFGFVPHLMVDTMAMARAMVYAYTGSVSLEAVAAYLGLGVKTKTILKVAGMSAAAIKAAGLWQEYTDYACNDGALCRDIFKSLRTGFPRSEYEVMDHVIRAAAIPRFVLNRDKLALHAHQIEQDKATLLARTGLPDRDALMSNDKFAAALESLGVTPPLKVSPTTGEQTYAFAKTDAGMIELEEHEGPDVQALVAARLGFKSTIEQTRTARFQAIANLTWPGKEQLPWMPVPLRYSGALTHRLSGDWKLNLQNLGRGSMLREALEAPPGHKVVVADASQIEARFNPYFAGQDDLVEAFRQGRDIYSEFAGDEVYRRPVNKKEHPTERFVGKQCLAAGTLVLTNKGPVAIEKVSTDHKVWDGQEWVCHKGLVQQGWKQTVKLSGVSLTPDHLVLCGTQWLEAQYLVRDEGIRSQALATAAVGLSSLVTSRVNAAGSLPSLFSATADGLMSTPATSPATSALSPKAKTPETSDKSQTSKLRLPVYDLLSAGPRHRFTILTDDGPLIVHNCILGLGYQMGAPKFQNTVRVQSRLQLGQELIISLEDSTNIVAAYRRRFSKIVDGWKTMQNALPMLASHDSGFEYGPFKFRHQKIEGPNGLCLFYNGLNHELFKGQWQWRFKYGREWKSLYGGKLCLSADTLVLTERGWVRIDQITNERVWDGHEWVSHHGVVFNGVRQTVTLDGVSMTPDHEVLTEIGWRNASSCEGLNRAQVSLPDSNELRRFGWKEIAVERDLRLRGDGGHGCDRVRERARQVVRVQAEQPDRCGVVHTWDVEASGIRGLAVNDRQMLTDHPPSLGELWSPGHNSAPRLGDVRGLLGGHGPDLQKGAYPGEGEQQRRVFGGKLRLGNVLPAGSEPAQQPGDRYSMGAHVIEGGISAQWDRSDHDRVQAGQGGAPVFDILEAGQRHQFVVAGETGPIIVHNCENLIQHAARIHTMEAAVRASRRFHNYGLTFVNQVHDELVFVVPDDLVDEFLQCLIEELSTSPGWAPGIPLAAEGNFGTSYAEAK